MTELVIVGGGAAGSTAAQFARKKNRKMRITIFNSEKYPMYSRCALPYMISGEVKNPIEFNKEWYAKNRIDLKLECYVKNIDISKRVIEYDGKESGSMEYDKLIIATGSSPFIPQVFREAKKFISLKTINDVFNINRYVEKYKRCAVIGAGPIGLEIAEAIGKRGVKVQIFEMLEHILPTMMDGDMVSDVEKEIDDLYLSKKIVECKEHGDNGDIEMISENGEKFKCDFLVICTGMRPVVPNIDGGNIKRGKMGHILVDDKCMTSEECIYASGDCTEYREYITDKTTPIGLGSVAVRQAIVAGINAAGGDERMPEGVINTRVTRVFGWELAASGPLTKNLEKNRYLSVKIRSRTKPDYYEGGNTITTKIIFDYDGRIVGAQMYGKECGVIAQKLNTFALCIILSTKIDQLSKLESAYSPPVAPTLDVFSIASMAAMLKIKR